MLNLFKTEDYGKFEESIRKFPEFIKYEELKKEDGKILNMKKIILQIVLSTPLTEGLLEKVHPLINEVSNFFSI